MTTPDPIKFLTDDRKLDAELLVEMGVKATNHDAIGPAVALPYRRDGKPYAWKFRGVPNKEWRSSHGVTRALFNEDCLRGGDGPALFLAGVWLFALRQGGACNRA